MTPSPSSTSSQFESHGSRIATIGFLLSSVANVAMLVAWGVGVSEQTLPVYKLATFTTCLAIPGTLISLVARRRSPRGLARGLAFCGVILGAYTSLFIATLFLPIVTR